MKQLGIKNLSQITLAAAAAFSFNAIAITGAVNGGDICEDRVYEIGKDIKNWIDRDGHIAGNGLDLPEGVSHQDYAQDMKNAIRTAKVSCVDEIQYLDKTNKRGEKTCVNYSDGVSSAEIICTTAKFIGKLNPDGEYEGGLSEEDQYRLIHHEYAGITGLENNTILADGSVEQRSNFQISNQISAYLREVTVKKLAVMQPPEVVEPDEWAVCESDDLAELLTSRSLSGFSSDLGIRGCKKKMIQRRAGIGDHYNDYYKVDLYFGGPGDACEVNLVYYAYGALTYEMEFQCSNGGAWRYYPGFFNVDLGESYQTSKFYISDREQRSLVEKSEALKKLWEQHR